MPARHPSHIERSLTQRHEQYRQRLATTSVHAKRLLDSGQLAASQLRERSGRLLAGIGLTGSLLLNSVVGPLAGPVTAQTQALRQDFAVSLKESLAKVTPTQPAKLSSDQAEKIEKVIYEQTSVVAKAKLEGQELNHQVGYIGYEQHLSRFPGDRLELHDEEQVAGIAPGLGAWGYFASSKEAFTETDHRREKYYAVAQVQWLPDFNQNVRFYSNWYKYRKILIVNPANGQAVVTEMGDVGPAKWTGKQFGASPEAMKALKLHLGPRKGLVIFMFIDDPNNQVPLGPLTEPLQLPQA